MTEFLPLCDLLFNVISLAGYFCDIVFNVVFSYALLESGKFIYFALTATIVLSSLILSQFISLRWFLNKEKLLQRKTQQAHAIATQTQTDGSNQERHPMQMAQIIRWCFIPKNIVICLHCALVGIVWRYAKLLAPVELKNVKHEVRDLCMLRLIHAFCESAPMLLLQLHILVSDHSILTGGSTELRPKILRESTTISGLVVEGTESPTINSHAFRELNIVSAALSLFSVCWALASFSKNVRLQNVHRLILTWLGVIFQLLWRLGTITSRMLSLIIYGSFYYYWTFLVIILHWISMFLWIISPKNVFHGERISRVRKCLLAALIAFVYVFAYINLQEVNHRQKMVIFYTVMFLENLLLVGLWIFGIWAERPDGWYWIVVIMLLTFASGIFFMFLYYRFFHIRRLGYEINGMYTSKPSINCGNCYCNGKEHEHKVPPKIDPNSKSYYQGIPGVFSCRFINPIGMSATKRKKKKPTSFVPLSLSITELTTGAQQNGQVTQNGPMMVPFWKKQIAALQYAGSSENESSVSSRIDIHQKLQEKKQKQLAELQIIEEEIKQGKLGGPVQSVPHNGGDSGAKVSLPKEPIPKTKNHRNITPLGWPNVAELNESLSDLPYLQQNFQDSYPDGSILKENNLPHILSLASKRKVDSPSSYLHQQQKPEKISKKLSDNSDITDSLQRQLKIMNSAESQANRAMPPPSYRGAYSPETVFNRARNYSRGVPLDLHRPRQITGTYCTNLEASYIDKFPFNVVPPPRNRDPQQQRDRRAIPSISNQRFVEEDESEVVLSPHYLERTVKGAGKCDGGNFVPYNGNDDSFLNHLAQQNGPSDIDSQVSLPRSYTLPREFKYYRRNRSKKLKQEDIFVTSNNSSDGDVDSIDDTESERNYNIPPNMCRNLNCNLLHTNDTAMNYLNDIRLRESASPRTMLNGGGATTKESEMPTNDVIRNRSASAAYPESSAMEDDCLPDTNIGNYSNALLRQLRIQLYNDRKSGIFRHETKL
ncbi:XK-related protein [Sergentomyia squamirostris]